MEIKITSENFESEVTKSDKPVILRFSAEWCGHCKAMDPAMDELSNEHTEIKFGKVDADDSMDLARQFKVMSIPALFAFKNGEVVNKLVGEQPKEKILEMVK